ncbi:ABC transporter ATP-binding protein [Salegentibacter salegens]|jgi:Cu-processing system ATP-binding protein|uniref:Cu-processing system ATP-binding protein n=1 Tax=Salegentibacter salegens TaxID=143223 RepID=A0A1M7NKP6_9FLAO|nr:ABC transporter ATP-binding protein [Salegentibacter salegens]PRX41222.1 Cu-processing system ATP-binding protein [Salegentibacter salegens]SHN04457.1 Cu-processing system ATP-binding protein [Salegentibacter salegens]
MVTVTNLHKRFGTQQVLNGLNLETNVPGIIAVLGPNGSGKTTLIKSLLGMVIPQKGEIAVNGREIRRQSDYRKEIDYLPQIANFPGNLTVKELIGMIKDLRGKPARDKELIAFFGIDGFLDKKLSKLSGGTRQKVNIVLCFMFDSPLVILDEPTSGLDPASLIKLKELLQKEKAAGKTIIITSHIMNFVEETADRILFLLEGVIYFNGSITELKTQTGQDDLEHAIAQILT